MGYAMKNSDATPQPCRKNIDVFSAGLGGGGRVCGVPRLPSSTPTPDSTRGRIVFGEAEWGVGRSESKRISQPPMQWGERKRASAPKLSKAA